MNKYDPHSLEPKWQQVWADTNLYAAADDDHTRQKYYYLVEFPYPSGDGLHVGHVLSYTALDIMARHKRMQGYNVLYPMGFDEFGLPTENYAIKHKIAPQVATQANVANFRRQLKSLGLSFDWNREVRTSDPNYYKWTQWIFLKLLEKGLAYQAELPINWCPFCKTGLANEEVVDGKHERCGTPVEKKLLTQWMLKITAYADRLAEDLKTVDYLDRIATQQINWIGRSEGAEIVWQLQGLTKSHTPKFSRVIVMHGKDTTPHDKWYPWLKEQAEAAGLTCDMPVLGAEANPRIDDWTSKLATLGPDERTIIVGHSRGGMAILRWLEQAPEQVRVGRIVLVATNDSNQSDKTAGDFFSDKPYNYAKIKQHCDDFVVIHSRDDEWVPFSAGETIAAGLGVELAVFEDRNHFGKNLNGKAPDILEAVLATGSPSKRESSVTVYTTRPDTIFGATFLVVSPEVAKTWIDSGWKAPKPAAEYIDAALKASELSRQEESKVKTGVDTGITAIHPLTGEPVPVWVADYVLGSYGTGAIMAVPAHDERDYEFAQAFELPITQVIMPNITDHRNPPKPDMPEVERPTVIVFLRDNSSGKYAVLNWHDSLAGIVTGVTGGIENGQTPEEAALAEIGEELAIPNAVIVKRLPWLTSAKYCASHKGENRTAIAHGLLAEVASLDQQGDIPQAERKLHSVEWVEAADVRRRLTPEHQQLIWDQLQQETALTIDGPLINSGEFNGLSGTEAKRAIIKALFDKGAGRGATKYRLRDWIFSRQHYWGEPIPVVHCPKDGVVPVPVDQLPIELPKVDHYEPTDTGESPLAAITDWVNTTCPKCGGPAKRETDTMPNWAGSSWYFLRYTDPHNAKEFASAESLKYWTPVDIYNGGMEHTTLHLLYSRFWHKFLYDEGLAPTSEPYARRRSHGMILGPDGQKMSKSKGNVINPDSVVAQYGADTIRLYEMFMGPFDEVKAWSEDHLNGVSRFMYRVWTWLDDLTDDAETLSGSVGYENNLGAFTVATDRIVHKTLKKVHHDIEDMHFNTAVSAMMELVNYLTSADVKRKLRQANAADLRARTVRTLVLMLAPFVPHLAEEIWHERLGQEGSVHVAPWPKYDPELIKDNIVTVIVQINGKLRGELVAAADTSEDDVKQAAQTDPNVARHLEGKTIIKTIVVPRKIINFVVKP